MIWIVLLVMSILISLASAFVTSSLLDYDLIEPHIYALTYFDSSDSFSYILLALLYAPLPLFALYFWRRSQATNPSLRAK